MATSMDVMADLKNELIRKALRGFIATAKTSVVPPLAITQGVGSELAPLGPGWDRLGNISKRSGLSFKRDTDKSEVESWGQAEASRVDKIKDVTGVTFECQETRRATLEAYYDVDLSTLVADATTGEVAFAQPTSLRTIYRRMLFIAGDGYGEDEILIGKLMPRWTVTQVADQSWSEEDPLVYGLTGDAMVDSKLGFAVKHFFGGPGWKKALHASGFNDVYSLAWTGTPTGTVKFTVNGEETAAISVSSPSAAAIQSALEALPSVGTGGVDVQGTASPLTITLLNGGNISLDASAATGAVFTLD